MRFLAYEEGAWQNRDGLSREAARELALGPVPVWVRADGVAPEVWDSLGDWFDLHPLALEDVRNARQRPKVEDYDGLTFLVVRIPRFEDELHWAQVGIFLGQGFIMTASPEELPELETAARRIQGGPRSSSALDVVFYHIVDVLIDSWFPFMDWLEDSLEVLEDSVLEKPTRENLGHIRDLKEHLSRTRKVLAPMREAMLSIERAEHPNIEQGTRVFLRDVADHTIRLAERLEHVKELALIAQETWNSTLANQQNETMKRLTIVAALLLLPSLLAGLGGMNFERGFPAWGYWEVVLGIFSFIVVGVALARWRGWL